MSSRVYAVALFGAREVSREPGRVHWKYDSLSSFRSFFIHTIAKDFVAGMRYNNLAFSFLHVCCHRYTFKFLKGLCYASIT